MKMAQHSSRFSKFVDTPGMYLAEHRRCVPDIIEFCNKLVYQKRLKPVREIKETDKPFILPHMGWAHIDSESTIIGGSRRNVGEAEVIADWVQRNQGTLEEKYKKPLKDIIGILTPFAAQKEALLEQLSKGHGITVGTVHALQGAERDIIIFSPVYDSSFRSEPYFDKEQSILNVAVSRAKDHFLVFGNMRLFSHSEYKPSKLLGEYLFASSDNEITDICLPSVISIKGRNVLATQKDFIHTLDGHLEILKEAMEAAQERLMIVSPYITTTNLYDYGLLEDLHNVTKRDVAVTIYTDPGLNHDKKEFTRCVVALESKGINVLKASKQGIHSKILWVDDKLMVLGSFNWLSARREPGHRYQRQETSVIIRDAADIANGIERTLMELDQCCLEPLAIAA